VPLPLLVGCAAQHLSIGGFEHDYPCWQIAMKPSLSCPACGKAIADFYPKLAQPQVHCVACNQHYGLVYGKLTVCSSLPEALFDLKRGLPSVYKRHYTLQITTADRSLKKLQFSLPGKAHTIGVHRGDVVSVLYTMRGYVMQQLVAIANHTTGKNYVLATPIPSFTHHVAVLLLLTGGIVATTIGTGANLLFALLLTVIGSLTYLKVANSAQLTTPPLDSQTHSTSKRLQADQELLAQKRKIEYRIAELQHERQANRALIEQLTTLKEKMAAVEPTLYSARIYRTTHAMKILQQQITNNQRLVREYERALKMIEIEVDTSWIADQLPDVENFTRTILERLTELKAIEAQNQSLKLQLTAYEEVKYHGIEDYQAIATTDELDVG